MTGVIPGGVEDRLAMLGLLLEVIERKRKLFPDATS
jgi:hypothetical protein